MNQRQLKYFLTVYKHNSISKAAEELFISPQGISKTILSLESELGVSLFEHRCNQIVPTSYAERLSSHAKNLLAEYELISERLFTEEVAKKELTIYCSYDAPQMIGPDFFIEFTKKHPDILIRLEEYPDNDSIRALDKFSVELAILPGPLDTSKYSIDYLCTEPFCLVVNRNHPLASMTSVSIKDIRGEAMAIKDMSNPTSMIQYNEFMRENIKPNILLETSDVHLIHNMAAENIALGMSLMFLAKKIKSDKVTILPFEEDWLNKTLYLANNKNSVLSYSAELFKSELLTYMNPFKVSR